MSEVLRDFPEVCHYCSVHDTYIHMALLARGIEPAVMYCCKVCVCVCVCVCMVLRKLVCTV